MPEHDTLQLPTLGREDEPCDALGIRIAAATTKTAPTASQEARHVNLRRDSDSMGTTPLCSPIGEARTRGTHFLERFIPPRGLLHQCSTGEISISCSRSRNEQPA